MGYKEGVSYSKGSEALHRKQHHLKQYIPHRPEQDVYKMPDFAS